MSASLNKFIVLFKFSFNAFSYLKIQSTWIRFWEQLWTNLMFNSNFRLMHFRTLKFNSRGLDLECKFDILFKLLKIILCGSWFNNTLQQCPEYNLTFDIFFKFSRNAFLYLKIQSTWIGFWVQVWTNVTSYSNLRLMYFRTCKFNPLGLDLECNFEQFGCLIKRFG